MTDRTGLDLVRWRARKLYTKHLRSRVTDPLDWQRIRTATRAWGYLPLLAPIRGTGIAERARLVAGYLKVDWKVLHGHRPSEAALISRAVLRQRPPAGAAIVEAGCWNGGFSCKLSLLARVLDTELHVYDSFEGVEPGHGEEVGYDFSGEYAATQDAVRGALDAHGDSGRTTLHQGWFCDTIAAHPLGQPIGVLYIDCDLPSGTREVLEGTVPDLVATALVYSQDTHLEAVRAVLTAPATWAPLGLAVPRLEKIAGRTSLLAPVSGTWTGATPEAA